MIRIVASNSMRAALTTPPPRHVAMSLQQVLATINDKSLSTHLSGTQSFVSNSANIYENLAIEEALLRAADLSIIHDINDSDAGVLECAAEAGSACSTTAPPSQLQLLTLSYINTPCAVVGRNQCVFTEVNVPLCHRRHARVARRGSGGGTVFHDEGNVNFTFLTHRMSYDPVRTIGMLMKFLVDFLEVDAKRLTTTGRHDIFLDGKKITGSAMRIQRDVAFHHCTLLVSSDKAALSGPLQPSGTYTSVETKSTTSVRSPVTTLRLEEVRGATTINTHQAARDIQHAFLSYVQEHGREVFLASKLGDTVTLSSQHPAPSASDSHQVHRHMTWALPAVLRSEGCSSSVFLLDASDIMSTPFVDAAGRKVPPRSPTVVGEEVEKLSSAEWVYGSMPALEVVVSIPRSEVLQHLTAELEPLVNSPDREVLLAILNFAFSKCGDPHCCEGAISCRLSLERGNVTMVQWLQAGVEPHKNGTLPRTWFSGLLSTYVEGRAVYADPTTPIAVGVLKRLQGEDAVVLWQQILFSCTSDDTAGDVADSLRDFEVHVEGIKGNPAGTCDDAWQRALPTFLSAIVHCTFRSAGMDYE